MCSLTSARAMMRLRLVNAWRFVGGSKVKYINYEFHIPLHSTKVQLVFIDGASGRVPPAILRCKRQRASRSITKFSQRRVTGLWSCGEQHCCGT